MCAICQSPIARQEASTSCPACQAPYHSDCWHDNGGCAVYGCQEVPETQKLTDVEVPVSYWGQENKPCPVCGSNILAAAVRCRQCGTTFESARPQDSASFAQAISQKMREPALRTGAIWVLITGLLPCTAPFCAIIGVFWFWKNRKALTAMPVVSRALAWIGIGTAVGQTLLYIILFLIDSISQ
jgi:predicted RNA-binding Zn-ribbon protein involved in translation (DUF1610 family)